MDGTIFRLIERRRGDKPPEDESVFYLREGGNIRRSRPKQGFCDGIAFGIEAFPRPMPHSPGREFRIGNARAVIPEIEKVFQVPEKDLQ